MDTQDSNQPYSAGKLILLSIMITKHLYYAHLIRDKDYRGCDGRFVNYTDKGINELTKLKDKFNAAKV